MLKDMHLNAMTQADSRVYANAPAKNNRLIGFAEVRHYSSSVVSSCS